MSCQKGMASVADFLKKLRFSGANALLAASEHLEDEVRQWQCGEMVQFGEHIYIYRYIYFFLNLVETTI